MTDTTFWPIGKHTVIGALKTSTAPTPAPAKKHFAIITDKSGSMGWAEDQMKRDMVAHLDEIPDGSYLSLGWFSGKNQYRWYMIGFKIDGETSRQEASKIINGNQGAWCMTCYTDILADLPQILTDINPLVDTHSVVFMTDGYPNQGGGESEILRLIKAVSSSVSDFTIAGFGDYYNRQLLAEMAKAAGGTLVHAGEIADFSKAVTGTIKLRQTSKRIMVSVPKGVKMMFAINADGSVTVLDTNEAQVAVDPAAKVYFPIGKKDAKYTADTVDDEHGPAYALALAQLRSGYTDAAMQTLSDIGDVNVVQIIGSAITNDEMGNAEAVLSGCVVDPKKRFLKGEQIGCMPDPYAPDILDALNQLMLDENAIFLPKHPQFKYKRIGPKMQTDGDFPAFEADATSGTRVSEIVWHSERLNANVRAFIKGHVDLRDVNGMTPESLGFARHFPTSIIRSYSIVSNGNVNVRVLPVTNIGLESFKMFKFYGILDEEQYDQDQVYLLHLDRLPVLSRGKRKPVYAEAFAAQVLTSVKIGAGLKILKGLLEEISPREERIVTSYSPEQVAFLAANGLDEKGQYSPPTKKADPTDELPQREFYASVKGLSSTPNLKAVREKIAKISAWNGKGKQPTYTAGEQLAAPYLDEFTAATTGNAKAVQIAWLTSRIQDLKDAKAAIDEGLNNDKFALLMTGGWFTGFPRGETTVEVDGYTVTFNTDTVMVKI